MSENNLVWIDLEMTGLDPARDQILEIASIVTDDQLNILEYGPSLIIHCSEERLLKMDDWNQKHHSESGLWQECIDSQISLNEAENLTLAFLKKMTVAKANPLCGNSIWQDRRFIAQHMPKLDAYLHYRIIDVSSFKESIKRWYPQSQPFQKKGAHRALDDIEESINELKHYRESYFR